MVEVDQERLYATDDASVWAAELAKVCPETDEGLMSVWFANAIETAKTLQLERSRFLVKLLKETEVWCETAATGDGGQLPSFELYYDARKLHWVAYASSFYDGGGTGESESPGEAVRICLENLQHHPERERAVARISAVDALRRHLRIDQAEALRRLERIEYEAAAAATEGPRADDA